MAHCSAMICQQVKLSDDAEWPKVADAVIEAHLCISSINIPLPEAMEVPAASHGKGLPMEQHLPPDAEIAGWLTTLGITTLCQWDVLVFLYRHQSTLLGAADLSRLLGYPSNALVIALDVLESRELVARSRVSQGARLYQFHISPDPTR